jgi:transcriptional regulator with XRE-family HTH domain
VKAVRKKLKEIRKSFGYTQESFSTKIGISRRTYRNIEQGVCFPRENLLKKIISELKINSFSAFENEIAEKRSFISEDICKLMNEQSDKFYTLQDIKIIRKSIRLEIKDRKQTNLNIKTKTKKGNYFMNKRCAEMASKEPPGKLIMEYDIWLYRMCCRNEAEERKGKATGDILVVR